MDWMYYRLSPLQKTSVGTVVGKFSAIDPEGDGLIFELGGLEGYHDMDIIHGYVSARCLLVGLEMSTTLPSIRMEP